VDLRHLRYFVHVAEELHFGRAARRLGVSQPPLSQQIQALEQELGVRLFDRSNRRVALTEVGRLFLPEARATLAQAARAGDIARRAHRGEVGELSIGITASAPFAGTIPRAIFSYRQAHPHVRLTIVEMSSDRQISALLSGELDVGFIRSPERPAVPADITATELFEDRLIVALRDDHPLATSNRPLRICDLAGQPFIFYARDLGIGLHEQVIALCRDAGFEPLVAQEAREVSTLLGLIAAGLGITVMSESLRALHVDHVVYASLDDPRAVTKMWLIQNRLRTFPVRQSFLDVLLSV